MLIKEITPETITINVEHFDYNEEKEILIENIRLLNTITQLNLINKICRDIKSPFQANTDIIFKVMDSLLQNRSFNDSELLVYFRAKYELEKFTDHTYKIIDYDRIYITYQVEMNLLGLPLTDFNKLEYDKKEEISEAYSALLNKDNDVETFIKKAKDLILAFKK